MTASDSNILVLGLGNTLLRDEAVGVRVAEHLAQDAAAARLGISAMDGGTMGLSLLVAMEDAGALIIVDAAQMDAEPGHIGIYEGERMDHFLRHRGMNPHDIGLDDLMDGLRLRGAVPAQRALIGVQPASLSVGEEMHPAVQAAVPEAAAQIVALVAGWGLNAG